MPLYREDLEKPPATCPVPGCDGGDRHGVEHTDSSHSDPSHSEEMWFHAKCHLDSPTWVRYRGDVLTIQCAACERDIVSLVIASRHDEP